MIATLSSSVLYASLRLKYKRELRVGGYYEEFLP